MPASKKLTVYVVQKLSWEYGDDFYYRRPDEDAPIRSFLNRDKAEVYRRQLEWQHIQRENINPFGYVDLSLQERSSLPLPEFLQRLREAGIDTEQAIENLYSFWNQYDKLSEDNKRRVWLATDRLRFFELLEMEVELEE